MNEPNPLLLPLIDAFQVLDLSPAEDDAACGEVDESPVLIKVLDVEPVAILVGMEVDAGAGVDEATATLAGEIEELGEAAKVEVEASFAWFSFYDLDGWDGERIAALIRHCAAGVRAAGISTGPGCRVCGAPAGEGEADARVCYVEGRVTRICPPCVEAAFADRAEAERMANRAHASQRLVFPAVIAGAMLAWGILLYVRLVYTVPFFAADWALGAVAGGGIGWLVGRNLLGTGLSKFGPLPTAIVATLAIGAGGNLALFLFALWWNFGVFSFELAFAVLKANLAQFGVDYAFLNAFQAVGFGLGCGMGSERRMVSLEL